MADKKPPRKPTVYSENVMENICRRLSTGETLRSICTSQGMPSWVTVYRWVDSIDGVAFRIARARDLGFDAIAEQALQIADTPLEGIETEESDQGMKIKKGDMLGHRKLQIETRLKLLAKWSPRKYGDKTGIELTGADGGPMQISDTERAAKIAAILATAQARKSGDTDDVADLV